MTMPDAVALECDTTQGFTVTPLLVTKNKGSWIEYKTTDFIDDKAELNPEDGEVEQANLTAVALNRKMGNKDQKIIILGDADCISMGELAVSRRGMVKLAGRDQILWLPTIPLLTQCSSGFQIMRCPLMCVVSLRKIIAWL